MLFLTLFVCLSSNRMSSQDSTDHEEVEAAAADDPSGDVLEEPQAPPQDTTTIVAVQQAVTADQRTLLEAYDNVTSSTFYMRLDRTQEKDIRNVVRKYVWEKTKFLKDEGAKKRSEQSGGAGKRRKTTPTFGVSHERPDLTQKEKCGYPYVVLKQMGVQNGALKDMAEFWTKWEEVVRHEVQMKRANVSRLIKLSVRDSKCWQFRKFIIVKLFTNTWIHLKIVLRDGSSKNSGAHQVECFRLQVFKENLINSNKDAVETSGSSSGGSSGSDTSSTPEEVERVKTVLEENIEKQCEINKKTAFELVKQAADEDSDGLMNIWNIFSPKKDSNGKVIEVTKSESAERMYWMFVDTCVFNTVPRKDWKRDHVNKNLSEFVHPTHEAFAMLVLENIALDFINVGTGKLKSKEEMNKKSSSSKYTKGSYDAEGRKKGWRIAGIERYNELVENVYSRRQIHKMKDAMDGALRKRYVHEVEDAANAETELNESERRIKNVVGLDLSVGDEELIRSVQIPDEYKDIANVEFV